MATWSWSLSSARGAREHRVRPGRRGTVHGRVRQPGIEVAAGRAAVGTALLLGAGVAGQLQRVSGPNLRA
ncbi:hypothetical protein PR202_gb16464 [Eleusine coracana subsp. coracana]|uniref:Uncharacterized protein n=1 Tax=Eleusine coracana subsp. coracana TaxID=191504 RepID=A0AAV5F0F9_ELECO|nr:hypothetical protein PR202_gb16464 [Eleusine coracana subsp. coracana]